MLLLTAQLVSSAAGLKGLAQQQGQKHLVATSVAGIGGGAVMTSSMAGQGIQLVGLQMQPGSRNITATVSAASNQPTRLSCPQLVRTLSGSGTSSGTTLKLTQTGGLQMQGGNATTGGIFGEFLLLAGRFYQCSAVHEDSSSYSQSVVVGTEFNTDDPATTTSASEAEATAGSCGRPGQ